MSKLRDTLQRGRGDTLAEHEGLALLAAVGVTVPAHAFVPDTEAVTEEILAQLPGERIVVKVVAPGILHKSDVGGVALAKKEPGAVESVRQGMRGRLPETPIDGFLLVQYVPHDNAPGGELLVSLRWTDDFGPIVVAGAGGVHTEHLTRHLKPGSDLAVVSALQPPRDGVSAVLKRAAVPGLATRSLRGAPARVGAGELARVADALGELVPQMPHDLREVEINPLVASGGKLIALDVLVELGDGTSPPRTARPVEKLSHLLEPETIALVGVSKRMNPGRVILGNLIRDGFPRDRVFVVKPGADTIDGCRCVPDVASLPGTVDLLVVSVAAGYAADAVVAAIEHRKAESIILIPGGLEEKDRDGPAVQRMHDALARARQSEWKGPLINGGNCLGIVSEPGRYDTMFIPQHKIGRGPRNGAPIAFISQSGAFAVSKTNKLERIPMKYSISIGNQMDVTVGDYLAHLEHDDVAVYAVYIEGFKPRDGIRFLEAAGRIVATGRHVVLYAAGRTQAGAEASASHTAALAGDYTVIRELARNAGVIVAESIADFEDLVSLFSLLAGKRAGDRIGAVSNAGFEAVAIADNLGACRLAALTEETRRALRDALHKAGLAEIVTPRNPIDLTPIMGEEGYEKIVRAVLADANVDTAVISCVPLTPALRTLPPGTGHEEDAFSRDALAPRLVRAIQESEKACVAVVDAGAMYDPMARILEDGGVPTFRTVDRAMKLLNVYCAAHFR